MTRHRWAHDIIALCLTAASAFPVSAAFAQQSDTLVTRLLNQGYALRRAGKPDSAATMFGRALSRDSTNLRIARELGFALLAAGDTTQARNTFRHVARLAPASRDDQAQLGYLDLALGDVTAAIPAFDAALRAAPNDATLRLQLAYTYEQVGNHVAARREFDAAAQSTDTTVQRQARASLRVLAARWYVRAGTPLVDWYGASSYGTRFGNGIGSADAHAAIGLDPGTRSQVYVAAHVIRDTRTRGGVQPVIFSDNYAAGAAGLRARPFPIDLTIYAEAGAASSLTTGGRSGAEGRGGLNYGSAWEGSHDWHVETYADASYYSRYSDVIGYLQWRQTHALLGSRWLDGYVREALTADSRGVNYNNLLEGGFGVRAHGGARSAAALYVELVNGTYFRHDVNGERRYFELRATLAASGFAAFLRR